MYRFFISTGNPRSNFCTNQEHHRRFSFDHFEVIVFGHVQAVFKLNVELLPFTDAPDHPSNAVHQRSDIVRFEIFGLDQAFEGDGEHGVTRVDGRWHAVFHVNGIASAANFIIVHDVVMHQGEIVDRFDGSPDVQQAGMGFPHGFGDEPREGGSHPLSSAFNQVHHGVAQPFVARSAQAVLNALFDEGFDFHDGGQQISPLGIRQHVTDIAHVVDEVVSKVGQR